MMGVGQVRTEIILLDYGKVTSVYEVYGGLLRKILNLRLVYLGIAVDLVVHVLRHWRFALLT